MLCFDLPLTIRTPADAIDLLVTVPRGTTLAAAVPALLAAAGLDAVTVLHQGPGPADGNWLLGEPPLLAGTVLTTRAEDAVTAAGPVGLSCVAGPDAGRWVPLVPGEPIVVGRGGSADLQLDDPALSRVHARIAAGPDGIVVTDLRSANGMRLDGATGVRGERPVDPQGLIRLGASVLRVGLDAEPPLRVTPDGAGRLVVARPPRLAPPFHCELPEPPAAEPERSRRPIPVLAAVLGACSGAAVAALTGMWMFLLLAALGPVMMLVSGLGERAGGRRGDRRREAQHRQAVAADRQTVMAAVAADRRDAWDSAPDPATVLRRAQGRSARLWERRPKDADFLRLTVGVGCRPARLGRRDPPEVDEVPLTLGLREIGILGLAGATRPTLFHLLAQLVVLHSPAELRLVVLSAAADLRCLRDLPHLRDPTGRGALIADEAAAAAALAAITLRPPPGHGRPVTTVVVLDGALRWRRLPAVRALLTGIAEARAGSGPRGGTAPDPAGGLIEGSPALSDRTLVALCLADDAAALPVECAAVGMISAGDITVSAGRTRLRAEPIGVRIDHLEAVARALTPLHDPDASAGLLPDRVALTELTGPLDRAAVREHWQQPTLGSVLGVSAGRRLELDLDRDGPHLLVAGTTGSGKSELLQTLVAGLALAAPPAYTSLLLVDYKGGAAFTELARLPHCTGLVTDLDAGLAARVLTGLTAEVRRRERVLAEAGVADLPTLRSALRRTERAGGTTPAPTGFAHLVVVVDEFATLAAELPDFLPGLVDVARRGRSLGIHLVLATQRPAGVLSAAVRANIGTRICLRVTDAAESVDVIDVPDAAGLPSGRPGRAVLRTGDREWITFQAARVTVADSHGLVVRRRDAPVAGPNPERATGAAVDSAAQDGHRCAPAATPTGLSTLVATIREAARDHPAPHRPWLPPLPTVIMPGPGQQQALARLDRPEQASQPDFPVPAGSVLVGGPPGSGRSTVLRRLAWCAATAGADLLVIDTAGRLADLQDWPATRTWLDGTDAGLVRRVIVRLHQRLALPASPPASPALLVLDGWESITAPLDLLDFGRSLQQLGELAGRGPSLGLRVAACGDLRLTQHRLAGTFTTLVLLGCDSRGQVIPGSPPGRGRIDGVQAQLLLSPPGPPRSRSRLVDDRDRAPVIRPLPSQVRATTLPTAQPTAIPIGLGDDDARPVTVDLSGPGGGLLVAGPRRSGVSSALAVLAAGAAAAGLPVVRALPRPAPALPQVRDIDVRGGPTALLDALTAHRGSLLLVADDVEDADPLGELLVRFLAVSGPGQYLALGARLDRALRSHRGPIAETAAFRTGLLLQAQGPDGQLLAAALPTLPPLPLPGRGYFIQAGSAIAVQVARR